MRLFAWLYDRTLVMAAHRRAPAMLAGVSAAESVFFPIPPDVMLAPMTLAQPRRGWYFAALCTAASVIGGLIGYLLGMFAFEFIGPLIERTGRQDAFLKAQALFAEHGFWIVLLAGFSPIPYKVFTIASGVMGMPVLAFLLGSVVGRGGRFFLVAGLIRYGGERMERTLRRNVEWLGWALVLLVVAGIAWTRWD
jgi:membrane protein YqaA with SNARE-associated domain